MKKFLIALALGIALVLTLATVASADNGPHGSFTATTDACASCHRAHTAKYGSNALLVMAPDLLCLSCHNGAGAGTDVVDGVYNQGLAGATGANATYAGADAYYTSGVTEGVDGASLFAGGFTNALMAHTWNGALSGGTAAVSEPTTSHHNYDGTSGTVWGSGANNSTPSAYALECVSCHDPHGTAGYTNTGTTNTGNLANACDPSKVGANPCTTKVASYRLLRWQPSGSSGFTAPVTSVNWSGGAFPTNGTATGWTVPDNYATIGTEWYTIGTQTTLANCGQSGTSACGQPFAVGDYNAGNVEIVYQPLGQGSATQTYRPAAINLAYFCAQCHDRYFNNSKLRDATDASAYCGHPQNGTTVLGSVTLTLQAPVLNATTGLYEHPTDPTRCEPVGDPSTSAGITSWGDNGPSGDTDYMYRHASGDVLRVSADGTVAVSTSGGNVRVARSCVACHTAHGTASAMTAFASDATMAAVAGADINNSVLLRMDNRSLCLRCHASTVNFTVAP